MTRRARLRERTQADFGSGETKAKKDAQTVRHPVTAVTPTGTTSTEIAETMGDWIMTDGPYSWIIVPANA